MRSLVIETPRGPAEVGITDPAGSPVSLLVLGHGAGGGVQAPDLTRVHDVAVAAGVRVALVTQPYRVAGRRAPAPANQLDEAWIHCVRELVVDLPLIVGGRSSGARVACRTSGEVKAAGVLCLAFPLHPPGRPDRSRAHELPGDLPTLIVNGDRDPFGVPGKDDLGTSGLIEVAVRPGATHDLRKDLAGTGAAVLAWLTRMGWAT